MATLIDEKRGVSNDRAGQQILSVSVLVVMASPVPTVRGKPCALLELTQALTPGGGDQPGANTAWIVQPVAGARRAC